MGNQQPTNNDDNNNNTQKAKNILLNRAYYNKGSKNDTENPPCFLWFSSKSRVKHEFNPPKNQKNSNKNAILYTTQRKRHKLSVLCHIFLRTTKQHTKKKTQKNENSTNTGILLGNRP